MLVAYPLGWIMNLALRGTNVRHIFATVTGIMLQAYMFRLEIIHTFFMSAITYLLMNVFPRQ